MSELIPIDPGNELPDVITRRTEIVASTLESVEQREVMQFFRKYPTLFFQAVQSGYPLTEGQVDQFADLWNWNRLSENPNVEWSKPLIQRFSNEWDWSVLSGNVGLGWTDQLIATFSDSWNWQRLSWNKSLPWSTKLIDRYLERWDWSFLEINDHLPWSIEFIERYAAYWNWSTLAWRSGPPWSIELLERFADRWDWKNLSSNIVINESREIIDHFADRWDWTRLEYGLPPDLWNHYRDRVPGNCPHQPWTIEKLIRVQRRERNWYRIALPGLTLDFIALHSNRWDLDLLSHDNLSECDVWPFGLIDRFQDKLNWPVMSVNDRLPWDADFVRKFQNRWDWKAMSENPYLPWSVRFIKEFESRWNFELMEKKFRGMEISLPPALVDQLLNEYSNTKKGQST